MSAALSLISCKNFPLSPPRKLSRSVGETSYKHSSKFSGRIYALCASEHDGTSCFFMLFSDNLFAAFIPSNCGFAQIYAVSAYQSFLLFLTQRNLWFPQTNSCIPVHYRQITPYTLTCWHIHLQVTLLLAIKFIKWWEIILADYGFDFFVQQINLAVLSIHPFKLCSKADQLL